MRIMAPADASLLKLVEHRRQELRRRRVVLVKAEAELSRWLERAAAAERRVSDGATARDDCVRDGASLRASGRHAAHLRQSLRRERQGVAVAIDGVMRARASLTAAAREQAAMERLLAGRRRELEIRQARADRALHDECAAMAHARTTRPGVQ